MSDDGRKRLKALAERVRAKALVTDEARHKKGLLMVELLSRDLTGDDALPELKLSRDAPSKFRVTRARRGAEITVEWQRDIGAAVMTGQKEGEARKMSRYILDEETEVWRRMEGTGELYEDVEAALIQYLYPEGKE